MSAQQKLLLFMDSAHSTVSIIAPVGFGKTAALRIFAIEAARLSMRVVMICQRPGQVKETLNYVSYCIHKRPPLISNVRVVHDLRTGGSLRCHTLNELKNMAQTYVADVLLIDYDYVSLQTLQDLDVIKFNKKKIMVSQFCEDYVDLYFSSSMSFF